MSSRAWTTFRAVRVFVFAISTLLSIAWTIMFMILLLREWRTYDIRQRAIVIISLVINGTSAIFLYLMIVVRFRLWPDAARVAFILLFQLGSTVTFALFSPSFPCDNLGSETDCRRLTSAVINGGWALSGLLLFYAFYLAVMSHIPMPPPRPNPEAELLAHTKRSHSTTPSATSETWLLNLNPEKRRSKSSVYSHSSFIQPLSLNPSLYDRSPNSSVGSPSQVSRQQNGVNRSNTPGSLYSVASSSIRSIHDRDLPPSLYPLTPLRVSPSQLLPNPFVDPFSRQPSPLSVSFPTTAASYDADSGRPYVPIAPPSAISSPYGSHGDQVLLPSPYGDRRFLVHPHVGQCDMPGSPFPSGHLSVPGTPMSLRPSLQSKSPPREYTASPGMQSVRSMAASVHTPSRCGSRSPAMSMRFLGLPASLRVPMLPLPPPVASGEIRRCGST